VLVQAQADLGGLDAAGGAAHQLLPHGPLKLFEVVAHIGAAHLQAPGGLGEVASVEDFDQHGEGLQFHIAKHAPAERADCQKSLDSLSTPDGIVKTDPLSNNPCEPAGHPAGVFFLS